MTTGSGYLDPAHRSPAALKMQSAGKIWPEFRTRFHCKTRTGMLSLAASDVHRTQDRKMPQPKAQGTRPSFITC